MVCVNKRPVVNEYVSYLFQKGTNITDEDLKDKVQTILVGLLADQERKQQQLYDNQRKEMSEVQATALANHRSVKIMDEAQYE